jgi:flagellar biosynthesis/type III secretory pathway chaperone
MTSEKIFSKLVALISEETVIASKLLSVLEEEATVLASGDPQAILTLSHRKQKLAEQLAEAEMGRCDCIEGSGLPMDLSALENVLKESCTKEAVTACQNLKQMATACAEYNRSNGIFVENRLRHVSRAFEIVTGRNSETELRGLTYGGQRNRLGQSGQGRSWAKV